MKGNTKRDTKIQYRARGRNSEPYNRERRMNKNKRKNERDTEQAEEEQRSTYKGGF